MCLYFSHISYSGLYFTLCVSLLQFSSTCQFIIGAPPQRGIFNAIKKDRFSTSNVSFIKANQKHLENLDMLKTWGFNLPYMLRVESVEAPNFMYQDDTVTAYEFKTT